MEKKRKIILIISLSLVSATVTYFGFGIIGTHISNESFFNVRSTSEETLMDDYYYRIQNVRTDYPNMAIREEITFKSNKDELRGYLYEVNNPVGVIVAAHGINSLADGAQAQYHNYFLEHNWDVFTFDMPGCGRSSGTMHSLIESRVAVKNAVETIQKHEKTKDLPLCLIGHSWGAYGVVTASNDLDGVSAVAAFSGYDSPAEIMYGFAINYFSPTLCVTKPALYTGLSLLKGSSAFYTGHEAIKNNPDIQYVIYQGDLDEVVPLKHYSIYDNIVKKNYSNITPVLLEGVGHVEPWKSKEANEYIDNVITPELDELKKEYGNKLPEDVFNEFMTHIDKEKASGLDLPLLDNLNQLFLDSVNK